VIRVRTLGGLAVERDGTRVLGAAAQPRRLALLAMIARAGPRGISRERLQATLWPEAEEEQGRHALKQALYALRRDAGAGELFVGTREVQLNPEEALCDVTEFEELVRRGELERAASRFEGPFLDGFRLASVPEFDAWMEEERRALERTLSATLARLAAMAHAQGDPAALVQWCRRRAALEPVNARITVELMRALLEAGDRPAALQQARIYESLVAQSLDLPPDESVTAFARDIREGRVTPTMATPAPSRHASMLPATGAAPPLRAVPGHEGPAPALAPVALHAQWTPRDAPVVAASLPAPASGMLSVAFDAFAAIPDDSAGRAFGHGLREELLSAFSRRHALVVIDRLVRTSAHDDPTGTSRPVTAPEATAILEGAVRLVGDAVRVTARLVRPGDRSVVWTERYDRSSTSVLATQDEIAEAIADGAEHALRAAVGLPRAPSPRDRADELYALGMRAWTPQGGGLGQGLEQFRQAIAIDPTHARAHAALAESYSQLAFYGFLPAPRAAALVHAAAGEAMRLAPDLAESRLACGTSLLWVEREYEAGIRELVHSLELDPTLVVAQARLAFVLLCHDGPLETGFDVARRAASAVGASGMSRVMYGQQLLAAGRYDDAIEALHAAIDIEAPSFLAYHWLSAAYVEKGMGAEAVAAAVAEASISDRHPWSLTSLVVACAVAGQRRRAEMLMATLKSRAATGYVQSSVLALAHAALGELDVGMSYLARAVEEHDPSMMMVRTFPMFAAFRKHREFRSLLRKAGWRDWDTAEFRIPGL